MGCLGNEYLKKKIKKRVVSEPVRVMPGTLEVLISISVVAIEVGSQF